ncbi:hypothetical protein [Umezawaea tangerina]|uniref:Uncharacterized protein n=1 Tax=Umezawaea tangerina TaxID=84725 RepID=A0A2T0SS53_9PSEU|nr:hypothetical protein [Umezawaea tangerina]PRY36239.1 hypothetical protein CLV43_112164 [Umezawaea tangerina]
MIFLTRVLFLLWHVPVVPPVLVLRVLAVFPFPWVVGRFVVPGGVLGRVRVFGSVLVFAGRDPPVRR